MLRLDCLLYAHETLYARLLCEPTFTRTVGKRKLLANDSDKIILALVHIHYSLILPNNQLC